MLCPKCGNQAPDDANFCMSCGADLSQYQQQSSEGGVNTGDVGMIKDSELKSTESQQQASIEQNPTINIHLGEVIRESVLNSMKEEGPSSKEQYERIRETSVSMSPDVADLLKKAKSASDEFEADRILKRAIEIEPDNDLIWYQRFLWQYDFAESTKPLKRELIEPYFLKTAGPPHKKWKTFWADMELKHHREGDENGEYIARENEKFITYFEKAMNAAPHSYVECKACSGDGLIEKDMDWFNCQACRSMGKVRVGDFQS